MLLFSRVTTPQGSPRRIMPWVAQITEYVNDNSSMQVTAWAGTFGYPIGTIAWSSIIESQAALASASGELLGQDGYLDLLESAADLISTPGEDLLREIVYGEPSGPPPLGAVGTITTAQASVDRMADTLSWSVEIAQHVENVTGQSVALLTDVYGAMGGMTWISIAENAAAADASRAALRGDDGYLKALAKTKDLVLPGSGRVASVTRIC